MRLGFCIVIVCMIVALAVCAHLARRSFATKTIARDVHLLLVALIPPMFGNLVKVFRPQAADNSTQTETTQTETSRADADAIAHTDTCAWPGV